MTATYKCQKCNMAVNATCANCNEPLVNDSLDVNGTQVQISKCPKCEGKIKSPVRPSNSNPNPLFPSGKSP